MAQALLATVVAVAVVVLWSRLRAHRQRALATRADGVELL
jgi:hypothetical protein